jgi:CubicO group peptidase (beta-lactamase class C family)
VIATLIQQAMHDYDLRAIIARVVLDEIDLITEAWGESLPGVAATPDLHVRNGNVAFAYLSTLLLRLVDDGVVELDAHIASWLPDLPQAQAVTLRMLANMTAGYYDYVRDASFVQAFYTDPFRQWSPQELIDLGLGHPLMFRPGSGWGYSHTNYVMLGLALEAIAGQSLSILLDDYVLSPLGLQSTRSSSSASIPPPALHTYTSERRAFLGIAPDVPFYEESTFWNPSWTTAAGAVQTTTIHDMTSSAQAIGTGTLLSPASHALQTGSDLVGMGSPASDTCPTCRVLTVESGYGLGVYTTGPWIVQSPLFAGCGATAAWLPSQRLAIGIVTTFDEGSFGEDGGLIHGNASRLLFQQIAAYLAPDTIPS